MEVSPLLSRSVRTLSHLFLLVSFMAGARAQTLFTDVTTSAVGMPRHGNAIVVDIDNDGVAEMVVGTDSTRLWKKQGAFNYTDITDAAGLQGVVVVSVADFNNDGFVDFLHTKASPVEAFFYRNNKDGTFSKVSLPLAETQYLTSAQELRAADIDGDGDLDLVFGRAVGSTGSIVCILNQSRNGTPADQPFSGVTTLALTPWKHNKAEVTDANNDGKPDLLSIRTTGDWSSGTHPDFPVTLFLNTGSSPADYLNADASRSLAGFTRIDNCGISAANVMSPLASWDIDNDGDQDLINGSSDWPSSSRTHIYVNDGNGNYTQMNSPVYQSTRYYHHWISIFDADLDNDMDAVWTGLHNFADTYPRMWRNDGDLAFSDVTSSWGITARIPGSGNHGMGGYHADLDEDGDLDFVVDMSNGWGSEKIYAVYRNNAVQNGANWLGVRLVSGDSAPNGIGARVEVTVNGRKLTQLMLDITGGVRNLSSLRFGLGSSATATSVKVYWPSGQITELQNVQGNRVLSIDESTAPSDSDNDGVNDYREGKDGTDPSDPLSFNPLSKGLVAYYPFDGNGNDESGNKNHLLLGNASLTESRTGSSATALEFTGAQTAPRSNANTGISGNAPFSVSFWVEPTSEPSWPSGFILGWGDSDPGRVAHFYYRPYTQGAADFNLHIDENYVGATVQTEPNSLLSQWNHITYTYEPGDRSFAIYLNGMLQTTNFKSFNMELHDLIDSPLAIGNASSGWAFKIDDIRLYNRTLTEGEVQQLYVAESAGLDSDDDGVTDYRERKDVTDPFDSASFNPLSKGLVAYYPFEGNANDESGYGDRLILSGASLSPDRFQNAQSALLAESAVGPVAESAKAMSIRGSAERTISFWVRMDVFSSASSLGVGWGNSAAPGNASLLSAYGTGEVNFWGHHADLNKAQEPNFVGFWRHVTFVYPGSLGAAKVYVDGRDKALTTGNQNLGGDLDTLPTVLKIAGWGFTETQAGAAIDELRVYNRALTGAEVAQLYAFEAADLDSDNDGLDDINETNTGTFVSATDAGTDPYNPDTSGDGILDGEAVLWNFNPLTDHTQVLAFLRHATGVQSGRFALYTEGSIMDLNLGGVMLQKSGNQASVRFKVESKMDLRDPSWTDRGTYLLPPIDMPGSKGFLRIRAEQP
jgi:hypothetical protein